jgi:hypothetical protein
LVYVDQVDGVMVGGFAGGVGGTGVALAHDASKTFAGGVVGAALLLRDVSPAPEDVVHDASASAARSTSV